MARFGAAVLLTAAPSLVGGHSFLSEPASRNIVAYQQGREYCAHCLQAGGPNTVRSRGGDVWPTQYAPESHGLCGDPVQGASVKADWRDEPYMQSTGIQQTYWAGQIIEIRIGVSTHHRGHYEFRICDRPLDPEHIGSREEGQACLDKWVLERAPLRPDCEGNHADADCQVLDTDQPHRWFLPPAGTNTQQAGEDWSDYDAPNRPSVTEVHKMRYKIPSGLSCEHCTLQWYWSTGNTCLFDAGYFSYFQKMDDAGWDSSERWCNFCTAGNTCEGTCCGPDSGKFGEEFWNCADIAVIGGGTAPSPEEPPSPTPIATPTPSAAPSPTQPPVPTPPVGSITCDGVCRRMRWSSCSMHNNNQAACATGYTVRDSLIVPCWWTDCGCIAGGDNLLECPGLGDVCQGVPPSPHTPTPSPDVRCEHFCRHEDLSQRFMNWTLSTNDPSYCFYYQHDRDRCRTSYVQNGGLSIPCMWRGDDCVANQTGAVYCMDFSCPQQPALIARQRLAGTAATSSEA